ncbi:MAG: chorismate synthase [Sedimentibacter sp.]|uniref:chorismate synthase n=1 Tax=Sedimentibacter sp. TaxID=1960295 RepID=UPI00315956AB
MSSMTGNKLKISIFGESHGEAIGVVMDGLPSGLEIDLSFIEKQMARRAPGKNNISTGRSEGDLFRIVSGIFEGRTTGAPLCAMIQNQDTRSRDYSELKIKMRPGHSDYTGHVKYSGFNDYRGGGHFSGRITAPLLFAGSLAMQILENYKGIYIGSRIQKIYTVEDSTPFEESEECVLNLRNKEFPVIGDEASQNMQQEILKAREEGDSVGGVAETLILNVPAGYGEPFFDSVESRLSHMMFSIPAVKAIEFGEGFNMANMKGSQSNDPYMMQGTRVITSTNNSGGILGGITNGMPIKFRTAIKPTPSISKTQKTVNIEEMQNTTLQVTGRHDPCILHRAIPVIDGAAALVVLDLILEREGEIIR